MQLVDNAKPHHIFEQALNCATRTVEQVQVAA
jgi:hypothetical protein